MYPQRIADPKSLVIASLIIYVILVQPVTYCLWKHGKRGILGWLALHSLCVIRIVGNAVQLNAYTTHSTGGTATLILQSVGLSPLLLAAVGILHEARHARNPKINQKFEWILVIQFHMTVIAAMVLVIIGILKLQDGASVGNVLMKVGMGVILACWAILALWTVLSFRSSPGYDDTGVPSDGTRLLHGVAAALPFIALREIFAAGSSFAPSSSFTSSLAVKICLSVVPEMVSIIILSVAGLSTRGIANNPAVAALAHPEKTQISLSIGGQKLAQLILPHDCIIRSQEMAVSNAEPGALKYSPPFSLVACDEVHPLCGSCQRHKVSCNYARSAPRRSRESSASTSTSTSRIATVNDPAVAASENPDARKRRLLELKLLYQYLTNTGWSVSMPSGGATSERSREIWVTEMPGLALKHDSLLNSIYCVTAMHLTKLDPLNVEALEACNTYFCLAIRQHRQEVSQLNKDNADVALLTASVIRLCAFVVLQDRELTQYTPPTEWFLLTKEAGIVFKESYPYVKDDPSSLSRELLQNNQQLTDKGAVFEGKKPWDLEIAFTVKEPKFLAHMMERTQDHERDEPWNADIEEVYKQVISFIGTSKSSADAKNNSGDNLRLLILFPIMTQKLFIDLVSEQQPRALVLLAHYFALLVAFREVWWIGDMGRREIQGIMSALPVSWHKHMDWPLEVVREGSTTELKNYPMLKSLNLGSKNP
ncbi:hypothetical protein V494_07476 [Pseudogymnoascus sp. VKM F-4513 (FW-928)]|nr:hypothetical protein V494_07476 [Pseudogymnoascus sp. VKM F-4513 (FW-928)]